LGTVQFGSGKTFRNFTSDLLTITGFTIFQVFNTTDTNTLQLICLTRSNTGSANNQLTVSIQSGNIFFQSPVSTNQYTGSTNTTLITAIYDGSLTGNARFKVRINGVDASPVVTTGTWPTDLINTYGFIIGSGGNSGIFNLLGNIGAFKFYNTPVDNLEITTVENELMTKFGI
jgi:hypothetical protein